MIGMALSIRNARLEKVREAIDAGGGPAKLCVYGGERPYTGGPASSKLCEFEFSHPCASEAEDAILYFDAISECKSAEGSGKATWARVLDSKGRFVIDLSVGVGKGEVQLKSDDIHEGMKAQVSRAHIGEGNP